MPYQPDPERYSRLDYKRCGHSGLLLPSLSLGLWHNFGGVDDFETGRRIIRHAFDHGITHFDLANNYGPPPGSAELNFGKILKKDFGGYLRDELVISSKAGYRMWPGPYGDWGSRKYLLSSLDQSLQRMGLDHLDIFYSHRPDPETPLEETMGALASIVKSGKAIYAGISNYGVMEAAKAITLLKGQGITCVIHQPKYSMMERWVEKGLLDTLEKEGVGCIPFSPLAQGLLTKRYLKGIPKDSRASKSHGALDKSAITPALVNKLRSLQSIAESRGQSLAQMALAWLLKDPRITSVLVGVSTVQQLDDNLQSLKNTSFTESELQRIEDVLENKPF
jgi:L-glyceraldehyde 3-phosphate reductase